MRGEPEWQLLRHGFVVEKSDMESWQGMRKGVPSQNPVEGRDPIELQYMGKDIMGRAID